MSTMDKEYSIHFERSGGFAGITLNVDIDSQQLNPEEKEKLNDLVINSGIFKGQEKNFPPTNIPDEFQYVLTVIKNGQEYSAHFSDSSLPDTFRSLTSYLVKLARNKKSG